MGSILMENNHRELVAKILIVGESQVGKTSILTRFTENIFHQHLMPTLGIDYKIKKLKIDDVILKLQIWDTAGQERYRAITHNFYKGSSAMVLVFDLTDSNSFGRIRSWLKNIRSHTNSEIPMIIMGNKCDMQNREVTSNEIEELLKEIQLPYMEVSAKENINIDAAFDHIAKEIKQQIDNQNEEMINNVNDNHAILDPNTEQNNNCCF